MKKWGFAIIRVLVIASFALWIFGSCTAGCWFILSERGNLNTNKLKPGLTEVLSDTYNIALTEGLTFVRARYLGGGIMPVPGSEGIALEVFFTATAGGIVSFFAQNPQLAWGYTYDGLAEWEVNYVTEGYFNRGESYTSPYLYWTVHKAGDNLFELHFDCRHSGWEDYSVF